MTFWRKFILKGNVTYVVRIDDESLRKLNTTKDEFIILNGVDDNNVAAVIKREDIVLIFNGQGESNHPYKEVSTK